MKKQILLSTFILISIFGKAQMQGPNSPAAASESANGCLSCPGSDWVNFANAETNNNINTTSGLLAHPNIGPGTAYFSRFLYVSNFGFTIPVNATINGIVVEIKRNYSGGTTGGFGVMDSIVQLMDTVGTRVGVNKNSTTPWTALSNYFTYGGATDMWGTSLTPTMINYSGFGVAVLVKNMASSIYTADIDHIRVTVYYTSAVGINEISSQSSEVSLYPNPATSSVFITTNSVVIESITIFDESGKEVLKQEIKNKEANLNLESLLKGIYFVEMKTTNGIEKKKFIKE